MRLRNLDDSLKRIVRVATSRWTKGIVLGLWLGTFLLMLSRGWVWESWESFPGGGYEHRWNYFDIKRTPLFVWLTLIIVSYVVYKFKQRSLGYFGLFEVVFGLVGGFLAVSRIALNTISAWLALAASAFVIIRGYTDIIEFVNSQETKRD